MSNNVGSLELRRRLARWRDMHLEEAGAFVKTYAEVMLSRELGNSQLHGLTNLARNVPEYSEFTKFLQHQTTKAERAGRVKIQQFWQALKAKFDSFRGEAAELAQGLSREHSVDEIHRRLVLFFVQHVIAESLALKN